MIDYARLKTILIDKNFNLLHSLIDYPQIDIYLKDYHSVDAAPSNPQESGNLELDEVTPNDYTYIQTVDCVYTFDKIAIAENDDVGSVYNFDVYVRYDDILPVVLQNKNSIVVRFDGTFYTDIKNINILYKIVIQFTLNG